MKRVSGEAQLAKFINGIPLKRMGTVDDIGQAAVFLPHARCLHFRLRDGGGWWPEPGRSALFNMGAEQMLRAPGRMTDHEPGDRESGRLREGCRIELNRPDKANAMNRRWAGHPAAFRRVDEMTKPASP